MYSAAVVLPVVIVIAISVLAAIAIGAWLVREVAWKAIEKSTPEGVAPVVAALGALLSALRLFLPWPHPVDRGMSFGEHGGLTGRSLRDGISDHGEGSRHDT